MYRYINAHSYLDYNVNPRGTTTGDCQTRAIATALGISWEEARKKLREVGNNWYNNAIIVRRALKEVFDCSEVKLDSDAFPGDKDYITVGEFCDTFGKTGTYLVACGDKDKDWANHLVCTINGTLYDTWDSSNKKVIEVYKPNGEHVTEGIEVNTDLPDKIMGLAMKYESCFNDMVNISDFLDRLQAAIPEIEEATLNDIDKRLRFGATFNYMKVHSFNFVLDIEGYYAGGMFKLKKKSYNIAFANTDTYASALAEMPDRVAKIYDNYCNMLIKQFKLRLEVNATPNNLLRTKLPQTLLAAYQKIDSDVRDKVVNMESFCGYTGAVVKVSPEGASNYYVMVLAKTPKALSEGIRICLKKGYEYWDDYHTHKINVLPNGFTFKLHKYYDSYSDDKKDFKEFLELYGEYKYDQEHNIDHDISWYFESWRTPEFLN